MGKNKKLFVLLMVCFSLACLSVLSGWESPVAVAAGLERDVIKIGVATALKRPWGSATVNGAEMAMKEINSAGGVLGAKIQLITADTEATAPKATEAIEKLYHSDKVDTIIGAYSSEEATAFQELSAKLKMNILFHGTTSMLDEKFKADPEKYKYYWNYIPADFHYVEYVRDYQIPLFIDAMKKQLGLEKVNVAVITDVALWTESLHAGWEKAVKTRPDAQLVYTGKISRDATDFTAELTEIRSKNVQLIIAGMGYSAAYTFIKQVYDVKLPVVITGLNSLTLISSAFLKAVGTEAAAYNTSLGFNAMPTTPNTAKLLKEYEKTYNSTPAADAGLAYSGVKAYAKAVEMAKSLDQDKVQKALGQVRLPESEVWNCEEYWFDKTQRLRISPKDGLLLYTIQYSATGEVNLVDPPKYKKGDILLPPWMIKTWKKK